jgi:hypothetical protein
MKVNTKGHWNVDINDKQILDTSRKDGLTGETVIFNTSCLPIYQQQQQHEDKMILVSKYMEDTQ